MNKRETGIYWVLTNRCEDCLWGIWEVASWNKEKQAWSLFDDPCMYEDSAFEEIDETPITRK